MLHLRCMCYELYAVNTYIKVELVPPAFGVHKEKESELWIFSEAKSRCKAATNLWADTDEEDNADSDDEDTHVETNVDQVGRGFPQEEVLTVIYYHSVQLKHTWCSSLGHAD